MAYAYVDCLCESFQVVDLQCESGQPIVKGKEPISPLCEVPA